MANRFGGPRPSPAVASQGGGTGVRFVPNKDGIANMEVALGRGAEVFANRLAERARELAPVVSGTLRDSIRVDSQEEFTGKVWIVVAETRYAMYVEIGTADTPAHPFLGAALDQLIPEFGPTLRKENLGG